MNAPTPAPAPRPVPPAVIDWAVQEALRMKQELRAEIGSLEELVKVARVRNTPELADERAIMARRLCQILGTSLGRLEGSGDVL